MISPCAEKLPTRVRDFCTKHNINQANIKSTKNKNHDIHDELDFFENLFKEFGINFTKTNKDSVLRIRKHLSLKDTELYLRETYLALKENKDVKNIKALFSSKIAKEERQINSKKVKSEEKKAEKISTDKVKFEEKNKIDFMTKYEQLEIEEKLLIEDKAINLLIKDKKINMDFIMKTRQLQPSIYKGIIKDYIKQVMKL